MIMTLLPIGIAVLGLVLFAVLTGRIREAGDMVKLKRHRSATAGVADLLNPAAVVEDGIIACKSGALMAAWIYEGDDLASSTDTDRNHVARRTPEHQPCLLANGLDRIRITVKCHYRGFLQYHALAFNIHKNAGCSQIYSNIY